MTDFEKLRLGRKYALGDGVCVDFEKTYELWKDIRHLLGRDDRELFSEVELVLGEMHSEKNEFGTVINYAEVMTSDIGENDVRALFERLILKAREGAGYSKIYKALEKLGATGEKKHARSEENIRLGNNIGEILCRFGWNVPYFLEIFNKYSVEKGLKPRTRQSLYQIIGGTNGMSESGKLQFVAFINEENKKRLRPILRRAMTVKDLDMEKTELDGLFQKPSRF